MEQIPLARIFKPALEEFDDFSSYIEKLHEQNAEQYGIIKIIPPSEWKPWDNNPAETNSLQKIKIKDPIIQTVTKIDSLKSIYEYKAEVLEGKSMTIEQYKAKSKTNKSMILKDHQKVTEDDFWSAVEEERICAIYGADVEASLMEENHAGSWNFSNFINTTLLTYVSETLDVPGIAKPYLYFGSPFSFFSWHSEDINLYSINFLHYGANKVWYGIPAKKAAQFEEYTKESTMKLYGNCAAPMRHKPVIIKPTHLQASNIDVYKVIQEPGEIVLTFPYSYHSGYNSGSNCAEAANFAEERWLPYGLTASRCTCGNDIRFPLYPYVENFYPNKLIDWIMGRCVINMPNNVLVQATRMTNVDYDYQDRAGDLEFEKIRKAIETGSLRRSKESISLPEKYQNDSINQTLSFSEDENMTDPEDFQGFPSEPDDITSTDVITDVAAIADITTTTVSIHAPGNYNNPQAADLVHAHTVSSALNIQFSDNSTVLPEKSGVKNMRKLKRRRRRRKELEHKKRQKYGMSKGMYLDEK